MKTINPTYAQKLQAVHEKAKQDLRVSAAVVIVALIGAAAFYSWTMFTYLKFEPSFDEYSAFMVSPVVMLFAMALWVLHDYRSCMNDLS